MMFTFFDCLCGHLQKSKKPQNYYIDLNAVLDIDKEKKVLDLATDSLNHAKRSKNFTHRSVY